MKAVVKYTHAISPCARDLSADNHEITPADLKSAESAKRWLKRMVSCSVPLEGARHTDCGGWVFFPMRKHGSVWWSVSVRLDVEEVRKESALCECRNHPKL